MSFAIINTTLLTMEGEGLGIIEDGAIGIHEDKISFVGQNSDLNQASFDRILDASDQLILPGLINGHFHSSSGLLRGCAQDVPELEWMTKALGPLHNHLSIEDKILGSKLAVIGGILTGTTTFAEYTRDVKSLIEQVYRPYGIRVVAAETINEISQDTSKLGSAELYNMDSEKGESSLRSNIQLVKEAREDDLVTAMFGPQALDMVSIDLLKSIYELSDEFESKIHMHVAQGGRERAQISKRFGTNASTVSVLAKNNLIGSNLYAAHCHDTTSQERRSMVENNVAMVSCQSSIAMIDGIVPPLYDYLSKGGMVAIGTDQTPGVGHSNLFREMRTAAILAKIKYQDPTKLPPWTMLKLATIGGARALGIDHLTGSLRIGKQADFITIDLTSLNLTPVVTTPFHNFIPNLVYSTIGTEVDRVFIAGEIVVEGGSFLLDNSESLVFQARKQAQKLMEQAEPDWRAADSSLVKFADRGLI